VRVGQFLERRNLLFVVVVILDYFRLERLFR